MGVTWHESSVVVCESEKLLEFHMGCQSWPFLDSGAPFQTFLYGVVRDLHSKKSDGVLFEGAFCRVSG